MNTAVTTPGSEAVRRVSIWRQILQHRSQLSEAELTDKKHLRNVLLLYRFCKAMLSLTLHTTDTT